MENFLELVDNENIKLFVEESYLITAEEKLADNADIKKINQQTLEYFSNFKKINKPYLIIAGLAGSGKSTLAQSISSKRNCKIITIDKLVRDNSNYTIFNEISSNEYGKLEYKVIICAILSKLSDNAVIDLGGRTLLQPGVASICKLFNVDILHIQIHDSSRLANLTHDAILFPNGNRRGINKAVKNDSKISVKFSNLNHEYSDFVALQDKSQFPSVILERFVKEYPQNENIINSIKNHCEIIDSKRRWWMDVFNEISTKTIKALNDY